MQKTFWEFSAWFESSGWQSEESLIVKLPWSWSIQCLRKFIYGKVRWSTWCNYCTLGRTFSPQTNITLERYVFQNVRQNADENIYQFYIRVKEQAMKCDFGATLDTEIKKHIILATNNNKLQRYCCRNQDVTLQQLLLHAKSLEDAESQAREIKKMTENVAVVILTRQRQPSQLIQFGEDSTKGGKSSHELGRKTCFQYGRNYPDSRDCPAKGKKCNKCQKEGHFGGCWRSKIRSQGSKNPSN